MNKNIDEKANNQQELILYHGSDHKIEVPKYLGGKYHNDYGNGFYCTEHIELAKEWACGNGDNGFVNTYSLDTKGLRILSFNDGNYTTLNWLAVLLNFRSVNLDTPLSREGADYIISKYYIELSPYEIIRGYRADDSYFSFVRAFISNTISLEQLSAVMRLGKLGEQIMIRGEQAFDRIRFLGCEDVKADEYYIKKKWRDETAKAEYRSIANHFDKDGIYLASIMRGEVSDECLQQKLSV